MMGNVIPFRTQPTIGFRLREIVRSDDTGEISGWFASNSGARAKFRVRVYNLQQIARTEWNKKQFRGLGNGLFEIKWKSADKQFRAIGFDHKGWFVLLIGCTHKEDDYNPRNCLETAARLKGEVENGEWRTIEFTP